MLQTEFNQLYDRLRRYANQRAAMYFRGGDGILRNQAAEDAMDAVIEVWKDLPVSRESYNEENAKQIIHNSVRDSGRKREVQPINTIGEEYDGMHDYKII